MTHSEIIIQFYTAFDQLDADQMTSFYHEEIEFSDPAFGTLKGTRACDMWKMLCSRQKVADFNVSYKDVQLSENSASLIWEAHYNFGPKKRRVHNIINSILEFKDEKIIKHIDHFDLHRWAKQAMGFKGYLLGNTSFFKKKLQQQTKSLLDKHIQIQD